MEKVKINLESKEFCYYLGYMWSDGHISKDKHYKIYLDIAEDDGNILKDIFTSIGDIKVKKKNFNKYNVNAKNHLCFYIGDKNLHTFLSNNDYKEKSYISPSKIISIIPKDYKKYFFLGLIDGDGCFYFNQKRYLRQFGIYSTVEQDWQHMINLSEELGIKKYNIVKKGNDKSGYSSCFRTTNKSDILKIHNFIYSNLEFIPLRRKYLKCLEIIK